MESIEEIEINDSIYIPSSVKEEKAFYAFMKLIVLKYREQSLSSPLFEKGHHISLTRNQILKSQCKNHFPTLYQKFSF